MYFICAHLRPYFFPKYVIIAQTYHEHFKNDPMNVYIVSSQLDDLISSIVNYFISYPGLPNNSLQPLH